MADVYVLPHADPTVRLVAAGHRVHDLHVAAVERLGAAVRAKRLDRPETAVTTRAVLAAAGAVLATAGEHGEFARLAALGALLALGAEHRPWSVRLRLDDLELHDGTTERPEDVLRAAAGAPFADEVQLVADAAVGDRPIVFLDRDQQLPALAALGARLPGPVSLAGGFAAAHWAVLREWLPPGSDLVDVGGRWRVRTGGDDGPCWLSRAPGAWLDYLSVRELDDVDGLPPGCLAAIVGVAVADEAGVIAADGERIGWPALADAATRLARQGGRLLVEQWLGAPGETARSTLDTAARLAETDAPWRIVGVRPFHLPAARAGQPVPVAWAGRPIPLLPDEGALARGPRFARTDLGEVQPEVLARLRRRGRLAGARVADAYLQLARDREAAEGPVLAPGVVVVAVDGESWLVDLSGVRTLRLDRRIGARLAALAPGAPIASAFAGNTRVASSVAAILAEAGVLSGGASLGGGSLAGASLGGASVGGASVGGVSLGGERR